MTDAHAALREVEMPRRFYGLQRDHRGYPVPFMMVQDPPSQITHDVARLAQCYRERLCGICGMRLKDRRYWVTGGHHVARNRVLSDPPMHEECARYSIRVCPFLSNPDMKYRRKYEDNTAQNEHVTTQRGATQILAMATSFKIVSIEGRPYVWCGRWRIVEHWSRGKRVEAPIGMTAGDLLVTAGELDRGGRLERRFHEIKFK